VGQGAKFVGGEDSIIEGPAQENRGGRTKTNRHDILKGFLHKSLTKGGCLYWETGDGVTKRNKQATAEIRFQGEKVGLMY